MRDDRRVREKPDEKVNVASRLIECRINAESARGRNLYGIYVERDPGPFVLRRRSIVRLIANVFACPRTGGDN